MNTEAFCKALPKIELHAHLNGSLSAKTLESLGCLKTNVSEYQKLTKLLNTTEKSLDDCFELFQIAQLATNTAYNVYIATKSVIEEFHSDNVIYLEIRTTPRNEPTMTKREYIEAAVKAIQDTQLDIIVKLLLSIDRRHDLETSKKSINLFVEMKQLYPGIVKGVDLSGNPKAGKFHRELFQQAADNGLFVALHCAEVENDDEVGEMLKFGPDRLGHATRLHPAFGGSKTNWETYCSNPIPVECCPTSNIVCGVTKRYEEHHVGEWIKNSLPFSLSTDDKGVFCTSLSNEFARVKDAFDVELADLWKFSYNSIDYAFANKEEKAKLRKFLVDWKMTNLV